MKLILTCKKCVETGYERPQWTYVEPVDEDLYEVICDKLHKTRVILEEQQFEVLFDSGAMALVDGYYRDSVVTFSSALEKFYSFFLELILAHHKIKYSEYKNIWNMVESSSERLAGAFYFTYLLEFKKEPVRISPEFISFRNEVVNEKYNPKYEEAFEYGEYLFKYMMSYLDFLSLNYSESLKEFIVNRMIRLNEKGKKLKKEIVVLPVPTIIHPPKDDKTFSYKSFKEALKEFKKHKTWMYDEEEKR